MKIVTNLDEAKAVIKELQETNSRLTDTNFEQAQIINAVLEVLSQGQPLTLSGYTALKARVQKESEAKRKARP